MNQESHMPAKFARYEGTLRALAISAALLLFGQPVLAALGDQSSAAQADRQRMQATLVSTQKNQFTVHELQTSGGITIREYAAPDGTLFAIRWQGPFKPDLHTLLGKYFAAYRDAPRSTDANHRHARIDLPNLKVIETGHLRLFTGLAWDPALLPAGVTADQLQ